MSPDDLNSVVSGGLGASGVLAFFVTMFIRGTIHTDSEHKQLREHYEQAVRQTEYWRTVAFRALAVSEKIVEPTSGAAKQETRLP